MEQFTNYFALQTYKQTSLIKWSVTATVLVLQCDSLQRINGVHTSTKLRLVLTTLKELFQELKLCMFVDGHSTVCSVINQNAAVTFRLLAGTP
jgi:hypothetical protein